MLPSLLRLKRLNLAGTQLTPPAAESISLGLPAAAKLKLMPNDTLLPSHVRSIGERLRKRLIK
jgi:hypothetical protein